MSKILIIGALPSSLINFRGELIKLFLTRNHQVVAMASGAARDETEQMESLGLRYIDYPVQRNGLNPLSDLKTLLNFIKVFKKEKPDVILAYTIKPVIWGGIAAKFFPNTRFYGLITGLGFALQKGGFKRGLLSAVVISLYRFALSKSTKVFFQNPDNLKVFLDKKITTPDKAVRVNGSGVDLSYFLKSKPVAKVFTIITIARLLGDKGLREYAAAAKIVKEQRPEVIFQLLGPEDPSPDGIPISEVNQWHNDGYVEYLGEAKDVRPYLMGCNVFVLASYHEGMPRTVLEAMAMGRPILTTNVPGCRETVIDGENGFLVEKQSVDQLVEKMLWFIEHQDQCQAMADKSRGMAVENFDVHVINEQLLRIMRLDGQDEIINA